MMAALLQNSSPSLADQFDAEQALEAFKLTTLAVSPLKDEALILEQLLKVAELQDESSVLIDSLGAQKSRLPVLTNSLHTHAMICRLSGDRKALDRIAGISGEARPIIDKWFSGIGTVPASAPDEVLALASVLGDIGQKTEAFSLSQDTLQLAGGMADSRSEKRRIDALMTIGLLENDLGRPDRAERTWSEVAKIGAKSDFPERSHR
jgi:hypothetical protein